MVQKTIDELKAAGKIEEFGISIYRPNDIIGASKDIYVDVYQVPMNLLDRNFVKSGFNDNANRNGIAIQARSIFLQGLLVKNIDELGNFFGKWINIFKHLDEKASEKNMSRKELALLYILNQDIESFVIGVETSSQLKN